MLVEVKDLVFHVVSTATVEAGVPLFACGMTLPALNLPSLTLPDRKAVAPHHSLLRVKAQALPLAFAVRLEAMVLFVMFGWCTVGIVLFFFFSYLAKLLLPLAIASTTQLWLAFLIYLFIGLHSFIHSNSQVASFFNSRSEVCPANSLPCHALGLFVLLLDSLGPEVPNQPALFSPPFSRLFQLHCPWFLVMLSGRYMEKYFYSMFLEAEVTQEYTFLLSNFYNYSQVILSQRSMGYPLRNIIYIMNLKPRETKSKSRCQILRLYNTKFKLEPMSPDFPFSTLSSS